MENERVQLNIISKFWKGERGLCHDCEQLFPIEEMKVVAYAEQDVPGHGVIKELNLYCADCFEAMSSC